MRRERERAVSGSPGKPCCWRRDESLVTDGGERDHEAGEGVERWKSCALEGGVCF